MYFLHDRPWMSPWIKSLSNEVHITFLCSRHNCLVIVTSSKSIATSSEEHKPIGCHIWNNVCITVHSDLLVRVRQCVLCLTLSNYNRNAWMWCVWTIEIIQDMVSHFFSPPQASCGRPNNYCYWVDYPQIWAEKAKRKHYYYTISGNKFQNNGFV